MRTISTNRTANAKPGRPWAGALRLGAAALLLGVGLGGTAGCEFIASIDRNQIADTDPTTSGGGNGGNGGDGGTAGGAGGQGGGGAAPVSCATPAECPGEDTECRTRTCKDNTCGFHDAPVNKPTAAQVPSNCKRNVCDGQGEIVSVLDDLDVLDDLNPCSSDLCNAGTPVNSPAPPTTACDVNGGQFCNGSGECVACLVGGDCPSGICMASTCVDAVCGDGQQNGQETDTDCGGPACVKCADLASCSFGSDCMSGLCKNGKCKVPTCTDVVANGQESDIDCGGPVCAKCPNGKGCSVNGDCVSASCSGTTCLPSCADLIKSGDETDVDCGGPVCPKCGTNKLCVQGSDCASGICTAGHCAPPICGDGVVNGTEACDDGNTSNTDGCLTTCLLPSCGDGHVQAGVEPCDDGNTTETDACLTGCIPAACGDGFFWFGVEACDDGNLVAGDGCSPTCTLEGCGDGVVGGLEPCDDGNLSNEDACLNDCTLATCGDGYVHAGVEPCDDGNLSDADACLSTCALATCGDGYVHAGVEGCDDANGVANDGCALRCAIEAGYSCAGAPSVCTSSNEINCSDGIDNDTDGNTDCADADCALGCHTNVGPCAAGETLLVYTSTDVPKPIPDNTAVTSRLTVGGLGKVTRAVAQLSITHTNDADLDISLKSPAGVSIDVSSDNGSSGDNYNGTIFNTLCTPAITSGTAPFASCYKPEGSMAVYNNGPAKGTWTLTTADDLSGNLGTLTAWRLSLCVAPSTCGDGIRDAGEVCDDGNSANADGCAGGTCATEPGFDCAGGAPTVCTSICGDGLVVGAEPCDDGNTTTDDGCSDTCALEPGYFCSGTPSACLHGDVEPNNTFAEADARALDPVPTLISGDVLYGGAIQVIGDKDIFKVSLAAPSVVRFELFDPTGADCTGGIGTTLRLYSAAHTEIYADNSGSGISACASILVNLAAGTYYVQVEDTGNNAVVPAYRLEVKLQSDQGSEAEVNDLRTQANPLGGSNVYVFGGHQVNTDSDFFAVTVPTSGMAIVAETLEGGVETCESNGVDSRLTLFSAAGTELANDDDDGRGYCSKIDGSGTAPLDTGARNLAAGTYYIQVRASGASQTGVAGQFDYKLVVLVR